MSIKTVYQLDAHGVLVGEALAYESPLEPGVFHVPAGCIDQAPPTSAAGTAARWNGASWVLVADHRGERWFDGAASVVIDFVGDPADQGYSAAAPEPSFQDRQTAKLAKIVDASETLLAGGAPVENGLHVALDDGSRADLTAMAATATAASAGSVSWPDSYSRGWITVENVRIPLATPAAGLTLAASVGNWYAAIVQHRRDLKDAALAAEDAAALDAIDETAGWPA